MKTKINFKLFGLLQTRTAKLFAFLFVAVGIVTYFTMETEAGGLIMAMAGAAGVASPAETEAERLYKGIQPKITSLIDEAMKNGMSKGDYDKGIKDLTDDIAALKGLIPEDGVIKNLADTVKSLQDMVDGHDIEMQKSVTALSNAIKGTSFKDQIFKLFSESEDLKKYEKLGFKGACSLEVAKVDDMSMTSNWTGDVTVSSIKPGVITETAQRKLNMRDVMTVLKTDKETHVFTEEYDFVDGVTTLAENAATGQSDFSARESSVDVKRLGTHLIISKRMMRNLKWLSGHISVKIPKRIKAKEDQQILFGEGAGQDLVGITNGATAFAAPAAIAKKIEEANEYDVLIATIATLTQLEYEGTAIIMNPIDVTVIELLKNTIGDYLSIVRGTDGIVRIGGLPVVQTTAMTARKFLVGDLQSAVELLEFNPITITMTDTHASIFLANQVCINFEEEILLPIYNTKMFVYGDFDDAILELQAE